MPEKKHYAVGDIVFLEEDGEMKSYKVMVHFDGFNTYLLKSCEDPTKIVEVNENQLRRIEEHNATVADGEAISKLCRDLNDTFESFFDGLSDDELEAMAPPEDDSLTPTEQVAYSMMYNAIGSAESIIATILHCATSDSKLCDAELLAMRDRADELGSVEIVRLIDMHFERRDKR